jgi:hypothetical protein
VIEYYHFATTIITAMARDGNSKHIRNFKLVGSAAHKKKLKRRRRKAGWCRRGTTTRRLCLCCVATLVGVVIFLQLKVFVGIDGVVAIGEASLGVAATTTSSVSATSSVAASTSSKNRLRGKQKKQTQASSLYKLPREHQMGNTFTYAQAEAFCKRQPNGRLCDRKEICIDG